MSWFFWIGVLLGVAGLLYITGSVARWFFRELGLGEGLFEEY